MGRPVTQAPCAPLAGCARAGVDCQEHHGDGKAEPFPYPIPVSGAVLQSSEEPGLAGRSAQKWTCSLPVSLYTPCIVVFPELERDCYASLYQGTMGGFLTLPGLYLPCFCAPLTQYSLATSALISLPLNLCGPEMEISVLVSVVKSTRY